MKEKKQTPLHEQIKVHMDGRKNNWLSEKTRIHQSEISRILSGRLKPSQKQLDLIKKVFPAIEYSL